MGPWCHGATAPRWLGAMASCCLGAMVPRCYGATVYWCHGVLVTWCHGAMAPRQRVRQSIQVFLSAFRAEVRWSPAARAGARLPGMGGGARAECRSTPPARTPQLLNTFPGSFCCAGFDNDPFAGSPMKTLLRLLLPLNDKVQWNSRDIAGSEPPTSLRSEHFTGSFNRYAAQETDFEQAYDALAPRLRWQAGQDVAARAGIQPDRTCRIQLTRRASKCSVDARPAPAPAPGKRCRALLPMRTLQGLKQVPLDTIARPVGGAEEMKARSAHARAPATTAAGARQRIGLGRMRAAPGARPEGSIQYSPLARRHRLVRSLAPAAPSWTTPPITDTSVQ
ncbi:hypothetical protein CQW23_34451 [Capsicum baccatum]|uniref:Uncharacterized protein n=1 Tax=Capsicum baccatum TaxID=33114 RepID=A0A2G2UYY0_CAPBA|nr:hypothetical protein CQW23_34451 [Capsicum baccatum]